MVEPRPGGGRPAAAAATPASPLLASDARRRQLGRTGLALGLLLLSLLLLVATVLAEVRTDAAVDQANDARALQDRATEAVAYAATAQRDYLLTRGAAARDRYEREAERARVLLSEAERLADDDPGQREWVAGLRPPVEAVLDELALAL